MLQHRLAHAIGTTTKDFNHVTDVRPVRRACKEQAKGTGAWVRACRVCLYFFAFAWHCRQPQEPAGSGAALCSCKPRQVRFAQPDASAVAARLHKELVTVLTLGHKWCELQAAVANGISGGIVTHACMHAWVAAVKGVA